MLIVFSNENKLEIFHSSIKREETCYSSMKGNSKTQKLNKILMGQDYLLLIHRTKKNPKVHHTCKNNTYVIAFQRF